ncbi:MAG: hypothetical protein WDW38_005827 [Sanguina aurantia]
MASCPRCSTRPTHSYMVPRMIITTLSIIFYCYDDLSDSFVKTFSCPALDPTEEVAYVGFMRAPGGYWASDMELKCLQGPHAWLALGVGLPGICLICIGWPLITALRWVGYNRNCLMDIDFEERYGFLYADYKPSYFYWDSIVMLRKLAMVVIVVFMNNGPKDGLTTYEVPVALGVIIFTTSIQVMCNPFKTKRANHLELVALSALVIMLYLALFIVPGPPDAIYTLLCVFLLFMNGSLLAYFSGHLINEIGLMVLYKLDDLGDKSEMTWET